MSGSCGGKQGKEPEKYHFVKGFERGLELFGQHRLREEGVAEKARGVGLVVVKGPNDVIALDALGVPAVALCATAITREQVVKVGGVAREIGAGYGDGDARLHGGRHAGREGRGARNSRRFCAVRLAWSETMHGGASRVERWSR